MGAGPGDPSLITVRGAELLARAEVVVYDGLIGTALLEGTPENCERVYGGKKHAIGGKSLSQDQINQLLVDRARKGKIVVRLKGGDPFLFGRGGEECLALFAANIPFEVVPGVSSATAVPAYAGIPLTMRGISSTVAFATGHEAAGKPETDIEWEALARAGTVVLFMAVKTAAECAEKLIAAGKVPDTPAAAIYWGTTASQRTITTTLRELGTATSRESLKPPALLVIGDVVRMRASLSWHEKQPLFHQRILVTRHVRQALPLTKMLAELGGEPLLLPVTRTVAPEEDSKQALAHSIATLEAYDWIVFTSANAVQWFFRAVEQEGRDRRALARTKIAAVGPVTAAAIREHGLNVDLVPETRRNAAVLGETLCAALGEAANHTRVLLPRAAHGRDDVAVSLGAIGAEVDVVASYATEQTDASDHSIAVGLARLLAHEIDVILFYAPSQVAALHNLLGAEVVSILSACKVVGAIGETTAAALRGLGVDVDFIPSEPSPHIVAHELADQLKTLQDERP